MKARILTVVLASLLSACAGTMTHSQMLQRSGTVRVEPLPGQPAVYRVMVRNDIDFGFDPDQMQDRRGAAELALRAQCAGLDFVGEDVIEGGTNFVGRTLRTYAITVRCQPRPPS